jgi:hypothetical protein
MSVDLSVSADSAVALWALAWELTDSVRLADEPIERRISIRINLFNRIYQAISGTEEISSDEIKRILESKPA